MLENKGNGRIPRYLDAPITILIWDVDTFLPAFVFILLGVFTRHMLLFWGLAFVYAWGLTKYQQKFPRGIMSNIMHRYGIFTYKGYPDGYIKKFRG